MAVTINKKLNIVIPMEDDAGNIYYLHSMPLSREAFQSNWLLLSQTFSAMVEQGIQVTAGPRVASIVMRDLAEKQGRIEDYDAIMSEIRRLTTVIKASGEGYEQLPLATALARGIVSPDDIEDTGNMLVFFTLVSSMWKGSRRIASLTFMNSLWQSENTSLSATAFMDSLTISTEAGSSGETAAE